LSVNPSPTNVVNSYTCPPRKAIPSSAVASSQTLERPTSPRWIAESASTIVSELASSTNDETEVNGMSNTSAG
jgi:hypothetical protein